MPAMPEPDSTIGSGSDQIIEENDLYDYWVFFILICFCFLFFELPERDPAQAESGSSEGLFYIIIF